MKTLLNAAVILCLLPACSAVSVLENASVPLEVYELRVPSIAPVTGRRNVELVVEEPVASGALAIERIMVRPAPLQAQYLPDVRWSDTAPIMLQTLLVRALTETGALSSVGRRPIGTAGDYAVLSELTDFQAEVDAEGDGATVRTRITLRIVRERDANVVASRTITAVAPATTTQTDMIIAAFDAATTQLLTDAVPWIIGQLR